MRADFIMLGGFLGAGKTLAMLRLAELLVARGRRVGLITNDQSHGLVDTTLAAAAGHPVREITGGCFCCRFDSLETASAALVEELRPDVIVAEPVGSCTDLRATVQHPLAALHGAAYRVAPLSVLLDPMRAAAVLGLDPGASFSPKVRYVYEKQLEEADLIVVNKIDLLAPEQRAALEHVLRARYPDATTLSVSAREGTHLEAWFALLTDTEPAPRRAMELDYDTYAEGEALLGWLNATARLAARRPFDGNSFLARLAEGVRDRLARAAIEIAHLKIALTAEGGDDLASIHLVRTEGRAEASRRLERDVSRGELVVNLRAEGDPDALRAVLLAALDAVARDAGVGAVIEREEHFRPSRPLPTHRMATP